MPHRMHHDFVMYLVKIAKSQIAAAARIDGALSETFLHGAANFGGNRARRQCVANFLDGALCSFYVFGS